MTDFNLDNFNVYMLELSKVENCRLIQLCNKAGYLNTTFEMSSEDPFIQSGYSTLISEMRAFEEEVCNVALMPLIYPHMARAYLNTNNCDLAITYAHSGYECSELSDFLSFSIRESVLESHRVLMDIAILTGAYQTLLKMHTYILEVFKYYQLDVAEIVLAESNLNSRSPQRLEQNEIEFKTKLQCTKRAPTFRYLATPETVNFETAVRCFTKMNGCTRQEAENAVKYLYK